MFGFELYKTFRKKEVWIMLLMFHTTANIMDTLKEVALKEMLLTDKYLVDKLSDKINTTAF